MTKTEKTQFIKAILKYIGFTHIGISQPEILTKERKYLNEWISNGFNGSMQWLKKGQEGRGDIFQYFPEVKSVISVGLNYYSGRSVRNSEKSGISNYAWGDDYHKLIKDKLNNIVSFIKSHNKDIQYRICVDTSPIMEKAWAQRAGLGWIGKHTNLINKNIGSWFFISEILLDIELDYDKPFIDDLCGTCTKCIDACPTDALSSYVLDSNKCISYLTIEHRDDIPEEYSDKLNNWIYGCDICQDVCPWNIKFSQVTKEKIFYKRSQINELERNDWKTLTKENFS